MKRLMTGFIAASFMLGAFSLVGIVSAEPVKLTKKQMASITAGSITPGGQVNGGGNTPNGNANGVPTTPATNPAGNAPPGQNK